MTAATLVRGKWRWMASIGLRYGYYDGTPVTEVHRPLMTSPWWTIAADNERDDFVRIFSHVKGAIEAAEAEYLAQRSLDTEVTYEVRGRRVYPTPTDEWVEGDRGLTLTRALARLDRLRRDAERDADIFHNGNLPRTYRLLKATTTYEEVR